MRFWMLFTAFASFTGAFIGDGSAGPIPQAPQTLAAAISSGEIAAMVMLLGFLGVIGGILFRWSSDSSWKERSVFSRPNR